MTIQWTPDGKVERYPWDLDTDGYEEPPSWEELANALDACVAALRYYADPEAHGINIIARETLRKLGVEP